ncbi:ROK family protein [Microbacterium hominis]|uniref:ROK family protein n=1 Tax=Microbacterium hominis TaxID=162426 RepID=UPI001CC30F81|nr:ROK family protein [Microbacterium hominis]
MTLALAIDLGGTKIEAALVDDDGAIVEGSRRRTPTGAAPPRMSPCSHAASPR